MNHLLTVEQLSASEIKEILKLSGDLKFSRGKEIKDLPLKNQVWSLKSKGTAVQDNLILDRF